ncbi:MAG: SpvB/TcaC N-terminal domain-containing protein [Bacteroidota bacterium]
MQSQTDPLQAVDDEFLPTFNLPTFQVDPSAGIELIERPYPNALGSANTSFSLQLTPGRNAMTPEVSVDYQSDHEHGWLGKGWDLSLPSIGIDTRWGVPRYDPEFETETYLWLGEQLAPVAHRGPQRNREVELAFSQRVNDLFVRITRHGNSPANYWWEVEYPDGSSEYYGGLPTQGVIDQATLSGPGGARVHWALRREQDAHGNRIDYHYQRQSDPGNSGSSENGSALYPDYLTYTGFGEEEGPYRVDFIRDRELGETRRPDVRIDGRLGFKQVTADLLRRIEHSYNGQPIRSYELNYTTGVFNTSLLQSLVQYDAEGEEFYRHEFNYFDDLHDDVGNLRPYGNVENYSPGTDNVTGNNFNPIPLFSNAISSLGGSRSSSEQIGTAITFGPAGSPATKDFTLGGTIGAGRSSSIGVLALVDINGDALPDKVIRQDNGLVYRANLGNGDFGPLRPINGINDFSITESSEISGGFEANLTPVFAGYENTTERSNTHTYFNDFNGDQLVDIVLRGTVYFNHLNAAGDPTFTTNSGDTPSPIVPGAAPDPDLITIDPAEQDALIDEAPLHDIVRRWKAPYDGVISLNAPVRLHEFTDAAAQAYTRDDGVEVSIQVDQIPLWNATIPADDYDWRTPSLNNINVTAGTDIYFRVQSIFNGAYDRVDWDPVIFYENSDTSLVDANRLNVNRFQASEDFLLASCQTVDMPLNGSLNIDGTFSKPATTDTVYVGAYLLVNGLISLPIFEQSFDPDEVIVDSLLAIDDLPVDTNTTLLFRIRSLSEIDWQALQYSPRFYYSSIEDGRPVFDEAGEPLYTNCPAVDYSLRADQIKRSEPWEATDSSAYELVLNIPFGFGGPGLNNRSFRISIKTHDSLLVQENYLINDSDLGLNGLLSFDAAEGDSLYFDLTCNEPLFARWIADQLNIVVRDSGSLISTPAGFSVTRTLTMDEMVFGNGYRGWGQFAYNGNRDRANAPLDEALLVLPEIEIDSSDLEGIDEIDPNNPNAFDDLEGLVDDPTTQIFIPLIAEPKLGYWRGYDDLTIVGPDYLQSSRLGEDDILLTPDLGGGGSAPGIQSISRLEAIAGGLSAGPGSLGASSAWNNTRNTIDVMDMNGDSYPDIVTPERIQYTTVYGGLSEQSLTHGFGLHSVRSEALGVTAGGKFVDSGPSNSGHSGGKGSRRRFRRAKATTKNSGAKAQSANESAESGGSLSGSYTSDDDWTNHTFFDMNGDGLLDKVWRGGDVALNYGYRFGPRENWGFSEVRAGVSEDFGAGLGINISNNSIAGGFSISRTDNHSTAGLQDINADGLADYLTYDDDTGQLNVRLNHGTGLGPSQVWTTLDRELDQGDATAESVNFAVTFCINIFFVRFCINPSASTGQGVSRVLSQFNDLNADGYLDEVYGATDDELKVRPSRIGRSNLLQSIEGPLGGRILLDYELADAEYNLPIQQWTLSKVEVYGGEGGFGAAWQRSQFVYESPNYERHEREFLGFKRVAELQLDTENNDSPYRLLVSEYANNHIYDKGLLLATYLEDLEGNRYREVEHSYQLVDLNTGNDLTPAQLESDFGQATTLLRERWEIHRDDTSGNSLRQYFSFTYDSLGNIIQSINGGNGEASDQLRTEYLYAPSPEGRYLTSAISLTEVYGGEELLRRTETVTDDQGEFVQLRYWLEEGLSAVFDLKYDEYGNLIEVIRPENAAGQRLTYELEYDELLHTYNERITDSYGYSSLQLFEPLFGSSISHTGLNGNTTTYQVDVRGRLVAVQLPMENVESYRFQYFTSATVPYARTERFDPAQDTYMPSFTFCDGSGAIVQHKRVGVVDGAGPAEVLIVSGPKFFDAFGRETTEYYPLTEPLNGGPTFSATLSSISAARVEYDLRDRPIALTYPDGSTATYDYDLAADRSNRLARRSILTDQRGQQTATYLDLRGRIQAHQSIAASGDIWMEQEYNALGELLLVREHNGFESRKTYDRLGRVILDQPMDGEATELRYDLAGNLIAKITPELRALNPESPLFINYQYDYERLLLIDYPKNFQNRVEVQYGEPDAAYNRAGRIWFRQDASGGEEFFFDAMGNTIKTIRTVLINEASVRTFVSEATYDSWGRISSLIYPDGELVTYSYLPGGRLDAIQAEKLGRSYPLLLGSSYDELGAIRERRFGNSSFQRYTYNSQSKRLNRVEIMDRNGRLQDWNYSYDLGGNPTGINQTLGPNTDGLGASSEQRFSYDEFNQLTAADGQWTTSDGAESYQYLAGYDASYNMERLSIARSQDGEPLSELSRMINYRYSEEFPHRVADISGRRFIYDRNGNQLGYEGERGSYRYEQFRWDEEDRLMSYSDNGQLHFFSYSADGTKVIQSYGSQTGVFTDGAPSGLINHGENYTVFISPYFTVTRTGFTKHYFADEDRIASKEGLGEFNNYYWFGRGLTAGDQNYTARIQELASTVWNYYGELALPPGPPTLPGYYAQPEQTGDPLPTPPPGSNFQQAPPGWPGPLGPPDPQGPPGPPTWFPAATSRDSIGAGYGYEGFSQFPEVMQTFYHSGPLGNVHLTTDVNGELVRHTAYLPNGELAFEQTRSQEEATNEFSFGGNRPIDESTSLYHFSSRFYDAEFGIWLSQDPLADDYPGQNPYAYVLHNPLRYTDPDGREPFQRFSTELSAAIDFSRIYNKVSIRNNWEYGANIYRTRSRSGKVSYFYDEPTTDRNSSRVQYRSPRRGRNLSHTANIHTHSRMEAGADGYNQHSSTDLRTTNVLNRQYRRRTFRGYMVNPRGELKVYDPNDGTENIVATGLPHDVGFYGRTDPNRRRRRQHRRRGMRFDNTLQQVAQQQDRRQAVNLGNGQSLQLALEIEAIESPRQRRRPRRGPGRSRRN